MGRGSMIGATGKAAMTLGARAGGLQEALPVGRVGAGGAERHGKAPAVVSASAPRSPSCSSSCAALLMERGGGPQRPPHPCFCGDVIGLESAGEEAADEGAAGCGSPLSFVFGPVPSREEVVEAVSTIQQIFSPRFTFPQDPQDQFSSSMEKDVKYKTIATDTMYSIPSSEPKSDWIDPIRQLYNDNSGQHRAREKVIDAFRSLQINPSIQRTVISLSSDKAVWDAVMKNEAIKELRKSICAVENGKSPGPDDGPDVPARLLKWIIEYTRAKIIEFVNNIAKTLNELLFEKKRKGDQMDVREDAIRSSFMLSIMVFIIVIIIRFDKSLAMN